MAPSHQPMEKVLKFALGSFIDAFVLLVPYAEAELAMLRSHLDSNSPLDIDLLKKESFGLDALARRALEKRDQRDKLHLKSEVRADDAPMAARSEPRAAQDSSAMDPDLAQALGSLIDNLVTLRPRYRKAGDGIMSLSAGGGGLEKLVLAIIELTVKIRDDLLEEKSRTLRQVSDIMRGLELTERDFIRVLDEGRRYLGESNLAFTSQMRDGLADLNGLVSDVHDDLGPVFDRLRGKVDQLHECVLRKKETDIARIERLEAEKQEAEGKLRSISRDYANFTAQSREMLRELEELKEVSMRDALTQTYNRRAYDSQIAKTIADHKSGILRTCGLFVFDVDHFKDFNNTYGHLAGDRVLVHVARTALGILRKDDFLFRYGGDEFVAILPNAGLEAAMRVAEKIRQSIAGVEFKLSKQSDKTVKVTLSMGAAEIKTGDDRDSFFARADQAMYISKSAGRNRVSTL